MKPSPTASRSRARLRLVQAVREFFQPRTEALRARDSRHGMRTSDALPRRSAIGAIFQLAFLGALSAACLAAEPAGPARDLTRPDGLPPNHQRKVKVFILMGQSNMVGMGDIGPEDKPGTLTALAKGGKKYPYLLDDQGRWSVRSDVYYYDARLKKGSPLGALSNNGQSIGPELGLGFVLGQRLEEPVLILKSCIGNRSLGWDLLPPGSPRFQAEVTERGGKKVTKVFAGYKDRPDSWPMDPAKGLQTEPPPWVDAKTGKPIEWYAGKQYDDDMANAKAALANLATIYPGYQGQGYEIAGFVWWQGHKDHLNPVHASHYEENLQHLIESLRRDYAAPRACFVLATGCGNPGRTGLGLQVAEAQLAIANPSRHPGFVGNVKAVDSRDLWREAAVSPRDQGHHYHRNAETYMEVGLRLGWAMAELLESGR